MIDVIFVIVSGQGEPRRVHGKSLRVSHQSGRKRGSTMITSEWITMELKLGVHVGTDVVGNVSCVPHR